MFSGKTTELLRRLDGRPPETVQAFKHVIDDRYEPDAIVTHGGKAMPGVSVADAEAIPGQLGGGVELVAVDEGHFFGEPLVDVCRSLAGRGISVIVTSLDRDSWGRPFPVAEQLAAIAEEAVLKQAVCARCGATGDRTQRLTPIVDGNMVGGPESYEPRCRSCWTPPPETPPG
jgi:thymidine kinase